MLHTARNQAHICQHVLFEDMTVGDFRAALRSKFNITQNLHQLLPQDLDFFICLSSLSGIVGLQGDGNYNAGQLSLF